MKDNESRIEEIETIIKSNLAEGSFANAFARKVAIQIVEHYKSKTPEDSVVLSREELNEKYVLIDTFVQVKEELEFIKRQKDKLETRLAVKENDIGKLESEIDDLEEELKQACREIEEQFRQEIIALSQDFEKISREANDRVINARKETAEKWYDKVKELYLENVGEQVFEHNWFGIQINKFAKQFNVELTTNDNCEYYDKVNVCCHAAKCTPTCYCNGHKSKCTEYPITKQKEN